MFKGWAHICNMLYSMSSSESYPSWKIQMNIQVSPSCKQLIHSFVRGFALYSMHTSFYILQKQTQRKKIQYKHNTSKKEKYQKDIFFAISLTFTWSLTSTLRFSSSSFEIIITLFMCQWATLCSSSSSFEMLIISFTCEWSSCIPPHKSLDTSSTLRQLFIAMF